MKLYQNTYVLIFLGVAVYLLSASLPTTGMPQGTIGDAVLFQISTSKTTYRPGERALVIFTVKNPGTTPIYLARGFICGKLSGYADFRILNSDGQNVKNHGCDGSELPIPLDKLNQEITQSAGWLRLDPGEIYGQEGDFEAPPKKGSYRLVAELIPPGFSDKERDLLASKHIQVLQTRYGASPVTIMVKSD